MTTRFRWLYVGAAITALLQTGILYAAIEKRAAILRSGAEVTLQTEPFDPRDLMRGDYVVLGYEISSLTRKEIGGTPSAGSRAVYVAVKPDANGIARFSRASFAPLSDLAADEVQIRGEAAYSISDDPQSNVRLNFGIERYYVPEGQGRAIEDSQRERRITAVIAVDPKGAPVIKALQDDGRQLYQEPLY
ncbi:GDYXXLXY domain-containing protein [Brucella intermedia]|uniref:GDYXXLXY domain-containing protein n=1 Tax=Brucella intermedia TaxID=94625 RepID=UPI0004684C0F|nr:GDYXXLXY domain-containing protein [Brucella intermedia]